MRQYLVALFLVLIAVVPWFALNYPNEIVSIADNLNNLGGRLVAVVINHNPKTVAELQSKYSSASPSILSTIMNNPPKKIRVLIVPGHEPDYGGAEYGSLKERKLVVKLANDLAGFLNQNNRYQVFMSRDEISWSPIMLNYFSNYWNDIMTWQKAHKDEVMNLTRLGEFKTVIPGVIHNSAPNDVAMRLYGMGKWANENDIDIVLHVHLNDYPGHPRGVAGEYSGFAIYVPEKQYANSTTTHVLADTIFKRLEKYNAVSDFPGESKGIIQDQELIAIGAYNSVDAPSMLIEYGYLYEPQFVKEELRDIAMKDLAFQTYLGLQDFFDPKSVVNISGALDTLVLPRDWRSTVSEKNSSPTDVFALQTVLLIEGTYPPRGKSKNDCPRTGVIGSCTKAALEAFQTKYGIMGEGGKAGPKTIETIKQLYPEKII